MKERVVLSKKQLAKQATTTNNYICRTNLKCSGQDLNRVSCRENELDKYRPITIAITILNWVEFDKLEQTNIQRGR